MADSRGELFVTVMGENKVIKKKESETGQWMLVLVSLETATKIIE